MRRHATLLTAAVFGLAGCTIAAADESQRAAAATLIDESLRSALQNELVISEVRAHNAVNAQLLTNAQIISLESQWSDEKKNGPDRLLKYVDMNAASIYLRDLQAKSDGLITEILVMGDQGLLVGQSGVASDFYQGDEAKFRMTYPKGADAVFVDDLAFDQSADAVQLQASFTLTDPQTGEPIGAATVGLNPDRLTPGT